MRLLIAAVLFVSLAFSVPCQAAFTGLLNKDCTIITLTASEVGPSVWVTWDGLGRNVKYNISADSTNKNVIYSVFLTAISLDKTVRLVLDDGLVTGAQIAP